MTRLLRGAWRNELAQIAGAAEEAVLIAAPYIKEREAVWLCGQLRPGLAVTTLTNVNVEAISSGALDAAALRRLAEASHDARLIALPKLHAKVFVADDKAAIVTSGNLTSAALDHNIEYGVLLHEQALARTVRNDMLAFARLGSLVPSATIDRIGLLERGLREARAQADGDALPAARRELTEAMRQARPEFVAAQVGGRTKHAVFGEAIRFVLAQGPLSTADIHEQVSALLPDLCDDTKPLVINGQTFGRAWKHDVRNAQLGLRRRGVIARDEATGVWSLA